MFILDGSKKDGPKRDKKGQMQIMEIITAGLVLMSALNFVATLPPSLSSGSASSDSLQGVGESSLKTLANLDSPLGYFSLLEEYFATGDMGSLTDHINQSLGETISYNLYLYPNQFDGNPVVLFKSGQSIGESTSAHHPLVLSQRSTIPDFEQQTHYTFTPAVYDIVLLMWYEPRGEVSP